MGVYARERERFLKGNDSAIATYGFSRAEFLKMTLLDIRPVEDILELLRLTEHPRPIGNKTAEK